MNHNKLLKICIKCCLFSYCLTAAILWNFNTGLWQDQERAMALILSLLMTVASVALESESEQTKNEEQP